MGTEAPENPDGRYTSGVFRVMVAAESAARQDNARFIGTDHLLIGLTAMGTTSGGILLALAAGFERFDVDLAVTPTPAGDLDLSPRARAVVRRAGAEAAALNHPYVGSGHILLALAHDPNSPGGERLRDLGIDHRALLGEVAVAYAHAHVRLHEPIEIEIDLRDGDIPHAVPPDNATGVIPQGQ